ncbi:MAG: hypothetical protein BIFFINMI_01191 [Phycisphaerae bacterium]|nr:hypothetical protein [Phycisphaerae bacterium]
MKFALIDRVVELEPGKRIVAIKNVALAEEYLQDHFPAFPVLPGVFMVQAMVEAATWLVRATEDFAHALVTLSEVRTVKYQSFLAPGDQLRVELTADEIGPVASSFRGKGSAGDRVVVQGKIYLRHENLADLPGGSADLDARMIERLRKHWELIGPAR